MNQFRQEVTEYVNSNSIPPSRIYTMDETGLWNGSVVSRTYVNPETMDSGVVSKGNHRRDTGVVAISADGRVHPYFIPHSLQKSKKFETKIGNCEFFSSAIFKLKPIYYSRYTTPFHKMKNSLKLAITTAYI